MPDRERKRVPDDRSDALKRLSSTATQDHALSYLVRYADLSIPSNNYALSNPARYADM